MKLSNIAVIFIIIVLPIIMVLSYYISLQIDTINIQTSYNTKQLDATKEAIEAFEINTVEWNDEYSAVTNSERRNIMASINTFITNFANGLGIGGTNRENILTYVPAIACTLYDGYYIYSPTETKSVIKDDKGLTVFMKKNLVESEDSPITDYIYREDDEGKILYEAESNAQGVYTTNDGFSKPFTLDADNATSTYSHILKPYSKYSARYNNGENGDEKIDIIVNYTLDNYITIYGIVKGKYVLKSGYFINYTTIEVGAESTRSLKEQIAWRWNETNDYICEEYVYAYAEDNTKVYFEDGIKEYQLFQVDDTTKIRISYGSMTVEEYENLGDRLQAKEQIQWKYSEGEELNEKRYNFIFADDGSKVYLEQINDYTVFQVNSTGIRTNLDDMTEIKYKKYSEFFRETDEYGNQVEKTRTYYHALNSGSVEILNSEGNKEIKQINKGHYYKDKKGTEVLDNEINVDLNESGYKELASDYSVNNFKVETKKFTEWIKENLSEITVRDMQISYQYDNDLTPEENTEKERKLKEIYGNENSKIFNLSANGNSPESEDSIFVKHKRAVIKESLISNLNQAITSYSRNSPGEYQLPVLTEDDWDQIYRNVSIVTFVQGLPIGMKYYNNYVIATSTSNREYVNPNEIYLIDESKSDEYYHMPYCKELNKESLRGYRNIDFVAESYQTISRRN